MRIEITGMTYGANAVGRADDGKVVFVAGGAPGDVVEVEPKVFAKDLLLNSTKREPPVLRHPAPLPPYAADAPGCTCLTNPNYSQSVPA